MHHSSAFSVAREAIEVISAASERHDRIYGADGLAQISIELALRDSGIDPLDPQVLVAQDVFRNTQELQRRKL